MFFSAITCFLMMSYSLPTIVADFSQKTAVSIEGKKHCQINEIAGIRRPLPLNFKQQQLLA